MVAGVVMNFTNILPRRFNNKRFKDCNYHDNCMELDTFSVLHMQTHGYSMWVAMGGNDFTLTTMYIYAYLNVCT